MLFNSLEFAIFLPIVFFVYWFVVNKNLKLQNIFILGVSYLFYGWWDWRFLLLIAFTSYCSYLSGVLIEKYRERENVTKNYAKLITTVNIILNLVILCIFKYFNFFSENFAKLFEIFGVGLDWVTLDVLLPVGISFYTFQALSYTIDVYKRKIEPTHDIVSFFAYVSFFPQLVAGPIERATNLLPQFYVKRTFNYEQAVNGTRQILWGLFKKIVVADNCAIVANAVFNDFSNQSGSVLVVGALMFTFQIYCDFSGYSDIAIGTARLFGIGLMQNFNFPYFSRDIAEFWRRWHISLTTWFRDYIYIPLGGSRGTKWHSLRNTLIIFLVSGFWHGANWTFVTWGAYNALLFVPLLLMKKNRKHTDQVVAQNRKLPSIREFLGIFFTFTLVMLGWIIFRAETITDAYHYICGIFNNSLFSFPRIHCDNASIRVASFGIIILTVSEWLNRRKQFGLDYSTTRLPAIVRYIVYLLIAISIIYLGGSGQEFIYFQF